MSPIDSEKTTPPAAGSDEPVSLGDVLTQRQRSRFKAGDVLLGRYRIVGELGQGGMGLVFKCFDEVGGIEVAVKMLPPEVSRDTGEMDEVRENFRIVEKLHHPNIAAVKTLERDQATGDYYLVMECVEGVNLRRWRKSEVSGQKSEVSKILPVVRQVAAALDYAHSQKIVHRDVKPSNVMIRPDGTVKVLDFGLAAQIHTSFSRVSQVRYGTSGTGPYMASEQWEGAPQDARTDQYALAVLTYELLAGRCPFESHDATVLRQAVLRAEPGKPEGLSNGAWSALKKALSKDRSNRFASCGEFVSALGSGKSSPRKTQNTRKGMWAVAGAVLVTGVAGLFAARGLKRVPSDKFQVPSAASAQKAIVASAKKTEGGSSVASSLKALNSKLVASGGPKEGEDWTSPSTGMEFVWIPALKIWVGKYEVTNGEYRKYKPGHDSKVYKGRTLNGDRQPVVQVNFDDAKEYAAWMTQQDAGAVSGGRYRLPSEDEWMVFAQCGDGREYPWGNNWPPRSGQAGNYHGQEGAGSWDKISGYNDGSPVTCNVGDSWKSPWGLFGVGGNVWEACAGDRSGSSFGAWRGASWNYGDQDGLRCSYRTSTSVRIGPYLSGFRLVLSRSAPEAGGASLPPASAAVVKKAEGDSSIASTLAALNSKLLGGSGVPKEGQNWTSPSTGMEFVWIPALKIWVGKYEVTNGEYRKYKPGHDSGAYEGHSLSGDRQPVVQADFDDAKEYAAWMTQQDVGTVNGGRYRLPSEDEWMAFAQCGDGREYPWGNNWPPRSGQAGNYCGQETKKGIARSMIQGYSDGHPVTCDVDDSWENPWGLFGVGGNVWEICSSDSSGSSFGAWRGASWDVNGQGGLRCSYRDYIGGSGRGDGTGFRLVLSSKTAESDLASVPPASAVSVSGATPPVLGESQAGQVQTVDLGRGVMMDLVWAPAGEFDMGSNNGAGDEKPLHRVKISEGFWIGKYEVTQRQWEEVMGKNPSYFKGSDLPVEQVSWNDCQEFMRRLNLKPETGNLKYRLPSEAEWEYACRAGTTGAYAGDVDRMGWYVKNSERKTHEVGQKSANDWGLYDMHGNVWEWCEDRYRVYSNGSVTDPTGPTSGSRRVSRGGSWIMVPDDCRSAARSRLGPENTISHVGFRVVAR